MTHRQLEVYLDQALAGILSENTGTWSFQYFEDWTRNGFALAPGLPLQAEEIVDSGSVRPVQWLFDKLLPEASARTQLINTITHTTSLDANAPKKMSVAGARQKLLVLMGEDGALFEPVGTFASTPILKRDASSKHYPCSAVNEWFCARLAQKPGLDIPDVELKFIPLPVYIIKRFDQNFSASPVSRLHALAATQLLSVAAGANHTKSGVESLVDISTKIRSRLPARIVFSLDAI